MARCCMYSVALVVAVAGVLVGTSHWGVTPPVVPPGSATSKVPLWPIFCVGVALNEFFEAAAWATRPPQAQVKSLATAYWQSEITYSLTVNGVIDAVGDSSGVACSDLASSLGLHADFLCRMMRAGKGLRLFTTDGEGKFLLTPAGELLRTSHSSSLRSLILLSANEETKDAWRATGINSLRDGTVGFVKAFGTDFWSWHDLPEHARQRAEFDTAMKGYSDEISGSLLSDWAPPADDALICDIGGGAGHMVIAMVQHYPKMKGLVFDLPPVVARTKEALPAQLAGRVSTLGGSFLDALPSELGRCDVFYLKFIIHDWADDESVKILANVAKVAKNGSAVVTTDFILGIHGPNMEMVKRMMDISMMALFQGARERSFEEYKALFARAGIAATPKLIKMRDLVSTIVVTL